MSKLKEEVKTWIGVILFLFIVCLIKLILLEIKDRHQNASQIEKNAINLINKISD